MKTITPTLTPTAFFLPADDLRAAFQCISATSYYLGGVFVEADNLVALDGHQMLTIELPDGCHVGTECFTQGMDAPEGAGFILSCDATDFDIRVAFILAPDTTLAELARRSGKTGSEVKKSLMRDYV